MSARTRSGSVDGHPMGKLVKVDLIIEGIVMAHQNVLPSAEVIAGIARALQAVAGNANAAQCPMGNARGQSRAASRYEAYEPSEP